MDLLCEALLTLPIAHLARENPSASPESSGPRFWRWIAGCLASLGRAFSAKAHADAKLRPWPDGVEPDGNLRCEWCRRSGGALRSKSVTHDLIRKVCNFFGIMRLSPRGLQRDVGGN